MGDMEQHEAELCRRDAVIDQYNDWVEAFAAANEARLTLVSWKRFSIQCWYCEQSNTVTKVGSESYELDCGHIADRQTVDAAVVEAAAYEARTAELYGNGEQYLLDCPVHLVTVRIDQVHGDLFGYTDESIVYELACGCMINETRTRLECHRCPLIDGVAVPMPRVTGLGPVIEAHRDPTQTYRLECGHVTF